MRYRARVPLGAFLTIALAPGLEGLLASPADASYTVPIVLSAAGVPPSFFSSELTVANRGTGRATVEVTYTSAFGGGEGSSSLVLLPGRQLVVPDAIEWLRSLGIPIPDSGNRGGTLLVRFRDLASPADGFISARTTTGVPQGRAGLAYSATNQRALPAVSPAADSGPLESGLVGASDSENGDAFPAPAPGETGAGLSTFAGGDPNGTWSLFAVDDAPGDAGSLAGGWCLTVVTTSGASQDACRATSIAIPGSGTGSLAGAPASLYPSTVSFSGLGGRVERLSVRLLGLSHSFPDDVDILLAAPDGRAAMLLSDAGGGTPVSGADLLVDESRVAVLLCGLRQDESDRSNVALVNASASGDLLLRVSIFSGRPNASTPALSLPEERLGPGEFRQVSGILSMAGLASGWVRVERTGGSGQLLAYAVLNDQGTSDGSFVPALPETAGRGERELTIPAVVESGPFATEVVLTNTTDRALPISLAYVAEALGSSDRTARASLTLAAGEQLVIPDFVGWLRGQTSGIPPRGGVFAGALFLSVPEARGLFAGARTSAAGGAGRFGVFYPAVTVDDAPTSAAWLFGLRQDAENRTNLAIVNLDGEAGAGPFRVEVYDGETGARAGSLPDVPVPPRGWLQIGSLLSTLDPPLASGYARVTRLDRSAPFFAYAVTNDGAGPGQRSGDGAFLAGERECRYTLPASATHGPTGGASTALLDAPPGCFWDATATTAAAATTVAASSASWLRLTSGASGGGSSAIAYQIDPNPDARERLATLSVAGRDLAIRQLGNATGPYDGSWTGTSVQGKPVTFTIERNEVTALSASLSASAGACRVDGGAAIPPGTRPVIEGDGFGAAAIVTTASAEARVRVRATFTSERSVQGTLEVSLIATPDGTCPGDAANTIAWSAARP